ncbi:phosphatase PAP2 family protein [Rhodococcus qingshengii]|uniref:phosphatase PAP2 family protein n=1 Tax=Rhodococcus qingshengii TaxID=334542 RepID=UPI0024B97F02|nr:phosphatase PAP2 family protein [Rhodococcus qingshengii]MDJ0441444.1 phosphatase PAP2 family protein [Rhodococcus qingshengii]
MNPSTERIPVTIRNSWLRQLLTAVAVFLVLIALGFLSSTTWVTDRGIQLGERIAAHRTGWGTTLAEAVTTCAQPVVGIGVAALVALWFLVRRRRVDAVSALGLMAGTLAVAMVAKYVVREPRPPQSLWAVAPDTHWSFPSGHTAVAAAVIGLIYLLTTGTGPIARRAVRILAVVFAVSVAVSRLYLGVHYLTDVAGGFLAAATAALGLLAFGSIPAVRARLVPDAERSTEENTRAAVVPVR